MTFKNLFIEHERRAEEEKWLKEEIEEQERRYQKIARQMDELGPQRKKWYADFFKRITTRGFNMDGDQKIVIKPENLPVQPDGREDKILWKYGVDGE